MRSLTHSPGDPTSGKRPPRRTGRRKHVPSRPVSFISDSRPSPKHRPSSSSSQTSPRCVESSLGFSICPSPPTRPSTRKGLPQRPSRPPGREDDSTCSHPVPDQCCNEDRHQSAVPGPLRSPFCRRRRRVVPSISIDSAPTLQCRHHRPCRHIIPTTDTLIIRTINRPVDIEQPTPS